MPVTPQPNSTEQIQSEEPEQCCHFFPLPSPDAALNGEAVFFLNYKNLMFILQIQNSHSASFIYFELLQVSAMVQASSQSGSRCSHNFKIKSGYLFILFFFLLPQTKPLRSVSTPSLMSSTCKHLVYLEG